MKNKILLILALILLTTVGCKKVKPAVKSSTTVSLSQSYDTLQDLKQGAANIVEVEVLDNNVVIYGELPFTISKLKVLASFKGDIKKNDEIKVLETGGKYINSGENPKDSKGQMAKVALGGIDVMQSGEHLILFIKPFVGPQVEGAYVPLGAWQGKFKVGKGITKKVEQQAPEEYKLKDYEPISKSKFIKKLEELK